jgi:hypothetical protein
VAGHAFQQRAHDRRFAGADLAGQLNEPAGFGDAVQKMGERLRVPLAHEEIAGIRSDCEGLFAQAKKARVHAAIVPKGLGAIMRPEFAPSSRADAPSIRSQTALHS